MSENKPNGNSKRVGMIVSWGAKKVSLIEHNFINLECNLTGHKKKQMTSPYGARGTELRGQIWRPIWKPSVKQASSRFVFCFYICFLIQPLKFNTNCHT